MTTHKSIRIDGSRAHPVERLTFLSKCFHTHLWPLARKARTSHLKLTSSDFDDYVPSDCRADVAHRRLERNWTEELRGPKEPSLARAMLRTYGLKLALIYLIDLIGGLLVEPMYVFYSGEFIDCVGNYLAVRQSLETHEAQILDSAPARNFSWLPSDNHADRELLSVELGARRYDFLVAGTLFGLFLVSTSLIQHPFLWLLGLKTIRIRSALSRLIYGKVLRIDKMAPVKFKQAMSLISRDVDLIDANLEQVHWILMGPGECLMLTLVLGQSLGFATASVSLLLNALVAIQRAYMNIKARKHTRAAAKLADERVAITSETFYAIRILRMCSWTSKMAERIELARTKEMKKRRYPMFVACLDTSVYFIGCSASAILTLLFGHYYLDLELNQANISRVFLVTGIYRRTISRYIPQGILSWINLRIVLDRVGRYLATSEVHRLQEADQSEVSTACSSSIDSSLPSSPDISVVLLNSDIQDSSTGSQTMIRLEAATLTWPDAREPQLRDIDLTLAAGELIVVAGRVGSGKSTLLQMILGEMNLSSGIVCKFGQLSYAAQEPWIFSGTVRDNILMGERLDETRYLETLRVCSLLTDLKGFQSGDLTTIGERGVTLSGGQKARVNLARCLYQQADIYLLDDPLSAVDPHVAQHIFSEAIQHFLRDKAVVLVTHQLQFLPKADKILLLEPSGAGYRSVVGTYWQLTESNLLSTLRNPSTRYPEVDRNEYTEPQNHQSVDKSILGHKQLQISFASDPRVDAENELIRRANVRPDFWKAIKFYTRSSASTCQLVTFLLNNGSCRVLFLSVSLWLNYWSGLQHRSIDDDSSYLAQWVSEMSLSSALEVLFVIWLVLSFVAIARNAQLCYTVVRGAHVIHDNLIRKVLWSKMSFFDVTPLGDLINRVSTDLSYMDTSFVSAIDDATSIATSVVFMVAMTAASEPGVLVALVPVMLVLALVLRQMVRLTDINKRVEGLRRSAVYTHAGTTLDGLATIRATGKQDTFLLMFDELLDRHLSIRFLNWNIRRWMVTSFDWILMVFYVSVVVVTIVDTATGGGTYAFVAIFMLMSMTRVVQSTFTLLVTLYTSIQSLDRIRQYSDLELEENRAEGEAQFARGRIEFLGVSLSYGHTGAIVLRDLSFTIEPREKIGVVGRTGAGKSSIIAVLFHLYHFEGFVLIDGQNTKQLNLDSTRRSLSIIPQDPVLFSGTLRHNLDPMDEYREEQLWQALRSVQMHELVRTHALAIDMEVSEGGSNFSVGQRQLICLARAILRRNQILVLDEATANVDPETDRLIQEAIRREFADCTVITVAHRLNTIVDSDRIMVMDGGRLVEFASPRELLEANGLFAQMLATDSAQSEELKSRIYNQESERWTSLG